MECFITPNYCFVLVLVLGSVWVCEYVSELLDLFCKEKLSVCN